MRCRPPRRRSAPALALAAAALALAAGASDAPGFVPARPGYRWSFPRDHWSHPGYRNEWWYLTGHLRAVDDPTRTFGYQLTFFRVGLAPERPPLDSPWSTANLAMVHAAVSDLGGGTHRFSDVLWREVPYLAAFARPGQHPIAWARAPAGAEGRWSLDLRDGAYRLEVDDPGHGLAYRLAARPERPIVLQGPDGLSRKSRQEGFASLYYSETRLATEGTITVGGRSWTVRGRSWLDREFGSSQLAPEQVGWDWFALQLADGRDLMLYLLRRRDGSVDFARGTLVAADGAVRWLAPSDFAVHATATWRSPETGATYPAAWRIEIPSAAIAIDVAPELADQENRGGVARGLFYWEGAVRVRSAAGAPAGEGYVELTGYGERSRPPI
jgi:predicted secreted hydrolase